MHERAPGRAADPAFAEGTSVAVLGAGGWGTALAMLLHWRGHGVSLWCRRPEVATRIKATRENAPYLSGVSFPDGIAVTSSLEEALAGARYVVVAVPSKGVRSLCRNLKGKLRDGDQACGVICAAKGIDPDTLQFMSDIVREEAGTPADRVAVLSGPSFASEVARRSPTAVVVASSDLECAREFQGVFMSPWFRVYTSQDMLGVQLGGALKNVYAIGAGLIDGLELGHNARAAYITRALAELSRLARAMGAQPATIPGLSGAGDLILTCTGPYSRNRWCGMELAKGRDLEEIVSSTPMVIEGIPAASAARALSGKYQVEMPIADAIFQVLYEGKPAAATVDTLMTRAPKREDA